MTFFLFIEYQFYHVSYIKLKTFLYFNAISYKKNSIMAFLTKQKS